VGFSRTGASNGWQPVQAYLRSAGPNGAIGYGFEGWDHAVIRLTGEDARMKGSPKGIGFLCPYDMTGIKEFEIVWPTKQDPRYKPTDWLKKEAETNRVFDFGGAKRVVVRTMPLPMSLSKAREKVSLVKVGSTRG